MPDLAVSYGPEDWQLGDWHPSPSPASPAAAVLMVHGGAWVDGVGEAVREVYADTYSHVAFLNAFGYAAWSISYASDDIDQAVSDVALAAAFVRTTYPTLTVNLFLWGDSSGAQLALAASRRIPGVAGIVSVSAPCDLRAMRRTLAWPDEETSAQAMDVKMGVAVRSRPGTWDRLSPYLLARPLAARNVPLVLCEWPPDPVVPHASHGDRLVAQMRRAGALQVFRQEVTDHAYDDVSLSAGIALIQLANT